jgi:hypothetical protein
MIWLQLLFHLPALAVFAWFTIEHEVPLNAHLILANGSADDLKAGFHARRTWVRFWWWLACCVGGSLPPLLWGGVVGVGFSFAALGILLAGFFLRTFGPLLNVTLRLDYKQRFYASPASGSFPDAYVWRQVREQFPNRADAELQQHANSINHAFLNMVFVGCLVLYVALMVLAIGLVKV